MEQRPAALELPLVRAQREQAARVPRQGAQRVDLLLIEMARGPVDDADGADPLVLGGSQGCAGVEANLRVPDDQGVGGDPLVFRRVGDDHDLVTLDRVVAERDIAGGLRDLQPHRGLEPLPLLVDQRHERDRGPADDGRERRDVVEQLLARRVEDSRAVQCG